MSSSSSREAILVAEIPSVVGGEVRVCQGSPAAAALLRVPCEDLPGCGLRSLLPDSEHRVFDQFLARLVADRHAACIWELPDDKGRGRAVDVAGECLEWAGSGALAVMTLRDRQHRERAERLQEAFAQLAHTLSSVSTPQEAATAMLRVADQLFGWDACHLNLYPESKDKTYSVVSIDTVDGVRKIFPSPPVTNSVSPMSRRVMEEGALLLQASDVDYHRQPLIAFGQEERRSESLMFVPIRKGDYNFGVLSLQSYTPGAYQPEDLQALQVLADHCSGALDRTLGEAKLRQQVFVTRKLSELGKKLATATTPFEVALVVLDISDELFGWDASYLSLYDPAGDTLSCVVAFDTINGVRRSLPTDQFSAHPSFIARKVLSEGAQLLDGERVPDVMDAPLAQQLTSFGDVSQPSASLLFVPIRSGDQTVGILSIQSYSRRFYSREDLDGLQVMADHCGGALSRTFAESRLRQSEERLRLITSQIPALVWSVDTQLRFTLLIGERLRMLRLEGEGLLGRHLREFFVGEGPINAALPMHQRALAGHSGSYEMVLRGHVFQCTVEPLRDAQGSIIGCLNVAHDITQRVTAEEELRKFHRALEQAANSVIISNRDLQVEYVNPAFEVLTGYARAEIIGRSVTLVRAENWDSAFWQELDERLLGGEPYSGVLLTRRKNGEEFYEDVTITPLKDEHGSITHFIHTGRDITEQIQAQDELRRARDELERRVTERTAELTDSNKQLQEQINERRKAEEKLERSLSMLRSTLESTTDGIVVTNLRGKPVNFNQKFIQMWDLPGEIALRPWRVRLVDVLRRSIADAVSIEHLLNRPRDLGEAEIAETISLQDGRIYECYSMPQMLNDRMVGRVWSFRDVTQRRRSEEALARSEAIYRGAIETAQGVPYRMRYSSDRYDFIGEGIQALLGMPAEEVTKSRLEKMVQSIEILDPHAPRDIFEYWRAVWQGEVQQYRVDLKVRLADGSEKWINDCAVPIRDENTGLVVGSLGILQDITQRKLAEEQNRLQQERLVRSEKLVALGTLVSGVAHEINNPNNFIMLNAPMLREVWESALPILDEYHEQAGDFLLGGLEFSEMRDQVPELIQGVLEGAKRIRNIVQELRDFARPHPNSGQEIVDLNQVVKAALVLVHNVIEKATAHFRVSYSRDLPTVRGNFQRLEQVIINLIQNACQSLDKKNGAVWVATTYDEALEQVLVTVGDEGRGIPQDMLKQITDPFFTTKRDSGGIGLGLSISSNIAHEHGGTLEFSSEEGRGTVATLRLPLNRSQRQRPSIDS